ncbi:MAG: caspase family protein [Bacteroidota bacterium]
MKLPTLISIFLLISAITWARPPGKHALIIAIGTYPAQSGWKNLGAENDVILIRSALMSQGFDSANIRVITNEAATYEGIKTAIRESLINTVRSGDIAVFHFSGHGQQVLDDNGDELDGYDEAFVPYDSPLRYQAGVYEGERLLRDDELGKLFLSLRRKLGKKGQLLSLFDACHSGTGTRGNTITRGTNTKMAPPLSPPANDLPVQQMNQFGIGGLKGLGKPAPMIAFFASGAHELNYEYLDEKGRRYGSLSYAFSKVFSNLPPNSSFQGLYDKVQVEMAIIAPRQHMQVEGELETLVMKGATKQIPRYFNVRTQLTPTTLLIEAGTLSGIHPGTEIHFFPADQDTAGQTPSATGVVTNNNLPLISEVKLDNSLDSDQLYWAYVYKQNYGNMQIRLLVDVQHQALRQKLQRIIGEYELVQEVGESADLMIEQQRTNGLDSIFLFSKDDVNLFAMPLGEASPTYISLEIMDRMLNYAQAMFLRNLTMDSRFLQVEVDLLPAYEDKFGNTHLKNLPSSDSMPRGIPAFEESEFFVFKVRNMGRKAVYYSFLDIQPDHYVTTAFPTSSCKLSAQDCYLAPDSSHVWMGCSMEVAPPYGNEVLKLIVTEEPLNLQRVISSRGKAKPGDSHPFERLFQSSFKNTNRGRTTPSIPPSTATVKSIVFQIRKKS